MAPVLSTPEQRIRQAKKVAMAAIAEATVIRDDAGLNRSTALHRANRLKAQALDEMLRVLKSK